MLNLNIEVSMEFCHVFRQTQPPPKQRMPPPMPPPPSISTATWQTVLTLQSKTQKMDMENVVLNQIQMIFAVDRCSFLCSCRASQRPQPSPPLKLERKLQRLCNFPHSQLKPPVFGPSADGHQVPVPWKVEPKAKPKAKAPVSVVSKAPLPKSPRKAVPPGPEGCCYWMMI